MRSDPLPSTRNGVVPVMTTTSQPAPRDPPAGPPVDSLGKRALRGSVIELAGYGVSQALRLGGNLVLTRLLFPDAFGLSVTLSIFLQGLVLLSDVGISQAVVQSARGNDKDFLDTAWTMQAVRGVLLFGLAILLAYPAAWYSKSPELAPLLLVGAVQLLVQGLCSTSVFTLRREVKVGWLTLTDLVSQVVGLAIMLAWALLSPSVWALIAGAFSTVAVHTVITHFAPVGYRNRFRWDPTAARAITRFGRWIFGSSAIFFFGRQGDRLLLVHYMGTAVVGIYSIAAFLSEAVGAAIERVAAGVLYPLFSETGRAGGDALKRLYYRARLRLDLLAMPALGLLTANGDLLVRWLWDPRYHEAGWMLQILTARVALMCMFATCENCLSAMGRPRYGFFRTVVRTTVVLVGMPIGYRLNGVAGLIWATVIAEACSVFVLWPGFRAAGMLRIGRELLSLVIYGAAVGLGVGLRLILT